jgi:hypothetical protein
MLLAHFALHKQAHTLRSDPRFRMFTVIFTLDLLICFRGQDKRVLRFLMSKFDKIGRFLRSDFRKKDYGKERSTKLSQSWEIAKCE